MLPIALQPLGCRDTGTKTPVDPPPTPAPFDPHTFTKEVGSWDDSNAMPLIALLLLEGFTERINRFVAEEPKVGFQENGPLTRMVPIVNTPVDFSEYKLAHTDPAAQDVIALTSGYLHYLHDGQAYGEVLAGAAPNTGEEILVLKPLPTIKSMWKAYQPGNAQIVEECAYSALTIDFTRLQDYVAKSSTLAYHNKIYEAKTLTAWGGSDADWPAAYLELFKQYPDVPIIVQGGSVIGSTTPDTASGQRFTMSFRTGDTWTANATWVTSFFKYHQRQYGLCGHPLAAKRMNCSAAASTVDFIEPIYDIDAGYQVLRTKPKLGSDFLKLQAAGAATWHPLAFDRDYDPESRLVLRKPPAGPVPPYLQWHLTEDFIYTRLKISNPKELTIAITGLDPAEATVTLLTDAKDRAPIFEFKVAASLAEGTFERVAQVTADGQPVHDLHLTFLDFRSFPVKFHKLADRDPATQQIIHQASIDAAKLDEVLAWANQILGQQANTYVYPVEEDGATLHDLVFAGDLGSPIGTGDEDHKGIRDLHALFITEPMQLENIQVVFAWDEEAPSSVGITWAPDPNTWPLVVLDTLNGSDAWDAPGAPRPASAMAKTLIHELGHWFSLVFLTLVQTLPDCSPPGNHFNHGTPSLGEPGCPEGDWTFESNLMTAGEKNVFISDEQALLYNTYAASVLP